MKAATPFGVAVTIENMKRKDKWLAFFLSLLLLTYLGLSFGVLFPKRAEITIENRKESLYDNSRIILPVAKEGSININTAGKEALMTLPQIGIVTADRIIAYRKKNGPFPHPACIMEVSGIGEKTYEKIKDKIKVTE